MGNRAVAVVLLALPGALFYPSRARAAPAVPPWSVVVGLGGAGSVELVADDQPALGFPVMTLSLERRLGATGAYLGVQIEIAWWLMAHGRTQTGALLGYEHAVIGERWLVFAALGGGYAAVSRQRGSFGHGPYARVELGVKYRPECMGAQPRAQRRSVQSLWRPTPCLRAELRLGPVLQATSLTYDTHDGDVGGRRLDPALLFGMALNF